MGRIARVVIPGCPHHVTQCGNNLQDVFLDDQDRVEYLEMLAWQADRFALTVEGYCLMPNQIHLVARPRLVESLGKTIGQTHLRYAQYFNGRYGRSGHMWQNRFDSCALGRQFVLAAMVFIERTPVRAGRVRRAWRHPWSSAAAHCGEGDPYGLLDLSAWARGPGKGGNWREALLEPVDEVLAEKLQMATRRGRPLGSDAFIAKLEGELGRRLRPRKPGRPRKNPDDPQAGKKRPRKKT